MTKGTRPDGRKLAPVMPWQELVALAKSDVNAIITYLRKPASDTEQGAGPVGAYGNPDLLGSQARAAAGAERRRRWGTRRRLVRPLPCD